MLNLNGMFDISYTKSNNVEIPNVENDTQNIHLTDVALARIDADIVKCSYQGAFLDQAFNMYQHVKKYGIDRTFLALYNHTGELDDVVGCKFPSCESVDYVGSPYSAMSTAFIAAMEDEQKGLLRRILNWIKSMIAAIHKGITIATRWIRYRRIDGLRELVNNTLKKYANRDVNYNLILLDYDNVVAQGARYLNTLKHTIAIIVNIRDNIEKHPDDLDTTDHKFKEWVTDGKIIVSKTRIKEVLHKKIDDDDNPYFKNKAKNDFVTEIAKMVELICDVQKEGTYVLGLCTKTLTDLDNEIEEMENKLDEPETQKKLQVYKRATELINKLCANAIDATKWTGKSSDNVIKRLHQAIAESKQKAEAKTADDKASATETETNDGANLSNPA